MPNYMISYLGSPKPMSPQEGQQHMAEYKQWMASLGESLLSPANPLKNTHVINSAGALSAGSATTMSGYSLIQAESYDAALLVVRDCPYLKVGGSLELSEIVEMSM